MGSGGCHPGGIQPRGLRGRAQVDAAAEAKPTAAQGARGGDRRSHGHACELCLRLCLRLRLCLCLSLSLCLSLCLCLHPCLCLCLCRGGISEVEIRHAFACDMWCTCFEIASVSPWVRGLQVEQNAMQMRLELGTAQDRAEEFQVSSLESIPPDL